MFCYLEFQLRPFQVGFVGLFLHEGNLFSGVVIVLWSSLELMEIIFFLLIFTYTTYIFVSIC